MSEVSETVGHKNFLKPENILGLPWQISLHNSCCKYKWFWSNNGLSLSLLVLLILCVYELQKILIHMCRLQIGKNFKVKHAVSSFFNIGPTKSGCYHNIFLRCVCNFWHPCQKSCILFNRCKLTITSTYVGHFGDI